MANLREERFKVIYLSWISASSYKCLGKRSWWITIKINHSFFISPSQVPNKIFLLLRLHRKTDIFRKKNSYFVYDNELFLLKVLSCFSLLLSSWTHEQ